MKKNILTILFAALLLLTSCSNDPDPSQAVETIPLSSEEIELLDAIGDDLVVISETDYANMVTEIIYHSDTYVGQVIQIEGIYSSSMNDDSIPYIYRTLTNNGSETICGLPLVYLEKEFPEEAWIRVSGIVNNGEINGASATVLEVVAIESLSEDGQKILEWTGSTHNH